MALTDRQDGLLEGTANVFVRYTLQDKDTSGTVQYYGFEITDTQWLILAIDNTNSAIPTYRYANVSSNSTVTSYKTATTGAWDSRAALVYSRLSDLSGV